MCLSIFFFFFQAEDGIRDLTVTGVQTCALPIFAHEVRNPLGAIRGAVQLLKRELGTDSRWSEYADVLLTEVDRVNRIIEMLLDLARPVQVRLVPLNLHQLLERVAMLHEEACLERKVGLVRSYDPSLPPILGDEDRLPPGFHKPPRHPPPPVPAPWGPPPPTPARPHP